MLLPILISGVFWFRSNPLFYALLLGVAPLWANDYGYPTLIAGYLLFMFPLFPWNPKNFFRSILKLFSYSMLSISCFLFVLYGLTKGHLREYFTESFLGFAKDQFWYFGPYDQWSKYYYLSDIFLFLTQPALCFLSAAFLVLFLFRREKTIQHLLFIALASCGAALLAESGGHRMEWRYWSGAMRCVPFFGIALLTLIHTHLKIKVHVSKSLQNIFSKMIPVLCHPLFVSLGLLGWTAWTLVPIKEKLKNARATLSNQTYVPELGTFIDRELTPSLKFAREELRGKRVVSEYLNYLTVISGTSHIARIDSIIHALGKDLRAHFKEKLLDADFVLTTSPNYGQWFDWNLHTNWDFYRSMLEHFKVHTRYKTLVVWSRKTEEEKKLSVLTSSPANCTLTQQAPNAFELQVSVEKAATEPLYEAEVCYERGYKNRLWYDRMAFRNRMLTTVHTPEILAWSGTYSANPDSNCLQIPVMPGGSTLRLSYDIATEPAQDTFITPKSCQVRYLREVPQSALLHWKSYDRRMKLSEEALMRGEFPVEPYTDNNYSLGIEKKTKKKIRVPYLNPIWFHSLRHVEKKVTIYGQERILKNITWDNASSYMYLYLDREIDLESVADYTLRLSRCPLGARRKSDAVGIQANEEFLGQSNNEGA